MRPEPRSHLLDVYDCWLHVATTPKQWRTLQHQYELTDDIDCAGHAQLFIDSEADNQPHNCLTTSGRRPIATTARRWPTSLDGSPAGYGRRQCMTADLLVRDALKAEIARAKAKHDRLPKHWVDQRDVQMAEVMRLIDQLLLLDLTP